jgi:hypothetical protein
VRFVIFGVAGTACVRQGLRIVVDPAVSLTVRLIAGGLAAAATSFLAWLMVGQFVNAFSFVSATSFAELAVFAFSIAAVFCIREAAFIRSEARSTARAA